MTVYKYRGTQTIEAETELAEAKHAAALAAQEAREAAHRALCAIIQADNLKIRNEKLQAKLDALRADKRRLQSRIIGLKQVRPVKRLKPAPVVVELADYSGPQGLAAAVEEAKQYRKRAA